MKSQQIKTFLALNEGRAMQMALIEEDLQAKECKYWLVLDSYTFIMRFKSGTYQVMSIDPISYEKSTLSLPRVAVSQEVRDILENDQES